MENIKLIIGKMGEDAACQYLINIGHSIIERNWRFGHLEIDIISLSKNGIHFIEVKSRTAPIMTDPENNVRQPKKQRIAKAAIKYLTLKNNTFFANLDAYIDVISVVFKGNSVIVKYFANAYLPIFI